MTDAIDLKYQTEAWSKPAELRMFEMNRTEDVITVGVTAHDAERGAVSRCSQHGALLSCR